LARAPRGRSWERRIGIDLTEQGSYGGVEVIRADARDLPFENETFDLVLSNSTLEHIPDFWRASYEMRRVLAPGGTLALACPATRQVAQANA
jgi:ubiquinone/menaquinone biosynthesis C-methylase UbiE